MQIEQIARLVAIVERSKLAEMEYTEDGARIKIVRKRDSSVPVIDALPVLSKSQTRAPRTADSGESASVVKEPEVKGVTVKAGMAGVFYRSSAPDKPSFVSVGDLVEEGQTLGILEAMKMLNPIEADVAGRVVQILQDDGTSIEAGTDLFIIQAVG